MDSHQQVRYCNNDGSFHELWLRNAVVILNTFLTDVQTPFTNFSCPLDIDECVQAVTDGISVCPQPRFCSNSVGGFQCRCPLGTEANAISGECEGL